MATNAVTYWAFIGTIYLIILSYQDIKNNRWVDDRKNYFMMGISFALITHFKHNFWYLLSIIGVIIIFNVVMTKYSVMGKADISTLTWVLYGFSIINYWALLAWVLILIVLTLLYVGAKKKFFNKAGNEVPYYPVLLSAFVLTCYLWHFY